jgi:excisionase family DNA binding protein
MTRGERRDGLYRTAQVAKILGISIRTLYRMLDDGRLDEPMRNPSNGYRIWTDVDVRAIRIPLPAGPAGKGFRL